MVTEPEGDGSIFKFAPISSIQPTERVKMGSYLRLFHPGTSTWLQAASKQLVESLTQSTEQVCSHAFVFKVTCQETQEDKDTFQLIHATSQHMRNIDTVSGTTQALTKVFGRLKQLSYDPNDSTTATLIRILQQALLDSIWFVLEGPQGEDPMLFAGVADPKRQHLMREWKILDLLIDLVRHPFLDYGDKGFIKLADIRKPQHQLLHKMCSLAYRVTTNLLPLLFFVPFS